MSDEKVFSNIEKQSTDLTTPEPSDHQQETQKFRVNQTDNIIRSATTAKVKAKATILSTHSQSTKPASTLSNTGLQIRASTYTQHGSSKHISGIDRTFSKDERLSAHSKALREWQLFATNTKTSEMEADVMQQRSSFQLKKKEAVPQRHKTKKADIIFKQEGSNTSMTGGYCMNSNINHTIPEQVRPITFSTKVYPPVHNQTHRFKQTRNRLRSKRPPRSQKTVKCRCVVQDD